jgi:hypothetical protein
MKLQRSPGKIFRWDRMVPGRTVRGYEFSLPIVA